MRDDPGKSLLNLTIFPPIEKTNQVDMGDHEVS
jgi:hypothetical protein